MKASIKFRDEDRPLMRAKVPIGVLGLPFQSGLSAGGDPRELRFDFSTAFASGPALRLSYRPNDPGLPFALSVRAGIGALGSPARVPFSLAAEFNLLSANFSSPAFFLLLKPRLGDFSLSHTLRSTLPPPSRKAGEVSDSEGHIHEHEHELKYKSFSLSGNGFAADVAAAGRSGGLGELLSGMRLTTRSVLPLWGQGEHALQLGGARAAGAAGRACRRPQGRAHARLQDAAAGHQQDLDRAIAPRRRRQEQQQSRGLSACHSCRGCVRWRRARRWRGVLADETAAGGAERGERDAAPRRGGPARRGRAGQGSRAHGCRGRGQEGAATAASRVFGEAGSLGQRKEVAAENAASAMPAWDDVGEQLKKALEARRR